MKRDISDYPPITKRIMGLINERYGGNVNQFCQALNLKNSVKVNRLFKRDVRNNEYPTPSTDIVLLISDAMGVSTDWLLKGVHMTGEIMTPEVECDRIDDIYEMLLEQQKQLNHVLTILEK